MLNYSHNQLHACHCHAPVILQEFVCVHILQHFDEDFYHSKKQIM